MQDHAPPATLPVEDPLAFLTGRWSTQRGLLDRSTGARGTFSGTTIFTPDGGGLLWDEEGTVSWPTFQGPAFRSYRIAAEDDTLAVLFPDDRLLCRLDLRSGRARDEHACTPDTYIVDFRVTSPGTVEYSWDVTGPAKDLLLTTTLTREG